MARWVYNSAAVSGQACPGLVHLIDFTCKVLTCLSVNTLN